MNNMGEGGGERSLESDGETKDQQQEGEMQRGRKERNERKRISVSPKKEKSYLATAPETQTRWFPRRRNGNNRGRM